mmetsp:Transcript_9092/g.13606  ORF Transcript_9092/g.13606 Transcript_9092/m.13606 type:complete len:429 (-) Transcript_9092:46-1332(-)|eukprot:CAMPEP_0171458896 /NCGR_PEP_ID=MMETSP0945-20130129/4393_1 /TAXON_ID=109269 /ORGANISM="Vaucheria litorea, Strain CCMP2940" /LENGTH=428 /DNA_ID=CAMNT_0011984799 /DNA_START=264 /DNA_END=1550 /DNA_ORIENTATION=+
MRSFRTLPNPAIAPQRRVVVTGLGAVSPLANGIWPTWERLILGESGIKSLEMKISGHDHSFIAGCVPTQYEDDKRHDWLDQNKWKFQPKYIQYALEAAEEAIKMSGYDLSGEYNRVRAGVAIGCGIGSLEEVQEAHETIEEHGMRKISPHFVPRILLNMPSGHVSIKFNLKGPSHCATTACASGAHSISDAFKLIKFGEADMMVAGGTESCINALSFGGFSKMRALSKRSCEPIKASCPFDQQRDGFVMAEGAAVLVLESLDSARKRKADILAEIRGAGLSSDGYHITQPLKDGEGAKRAMLSAIEQGNLELDHIDYVNAHATSTPIGDAAEAEAISSIFKNQRKLCVSSTKGATGHLLGAAGALEVAFSVLAIHRECIPHTLNLENPSPKMELNFVMGHCVEKKVGGVLCNSFGFGGTNISILLSKI